MTAFRCALLSLLLVSCAELPTVRSHLDPDTGVTLTVVTRPWIFARERRDVAVNARDYLTLVCAEIDEAGRRRLIVAAHEWSTIDSRAAGLASGATGKLLLVIDGRDIVLTPLPPNTTAFARSRALLRPDDAHVRTTIYAVDRGALDYAATGHDVVASFPDAALALPYLSWRDGRSAVSELLRELGL